MKRVLVDFSHVAMRNVFMHLGTINELNNDHWGDGFVFLKYNIFNSLFSLNKKFKPEELIICTDGKDNWRKKIYEDYKGNRKVTRDKSDIDWPAMYEAIDDIVVQIKENFPYHVIGHNSMEADDVIAWFCQKHNKESY